MNNELKIFENQEFGQVRALELDGNPYFLNADIARALGYSNVYDALRQHVDKEDRRTLDFKGFSQIARSLWNGENDFSNKIVINESGVYSLIMGSKLKSAKRFKHWVTSEVLPSIRKHGAYATSDTIDRMIGDPDFGIRLLNELKSEREARLIAEAKTARLTAENNDMKPKSDYFDQVLATKGLIKIEDIAKLFGKSARWLNSYLEKKGIQFRRSKKSPWQLYNKFAGLGYARTTTYINFHSGYSTCTEHLKWTQKGKKFICDLLIADGYKPIMPLDD